MRRGFCLLAFLAACTAEAPPANEFPAEARTVFAEGCPAGDPRCDCMWDEILRTMTYEEFDLAMSRFKAEGLMDPRLTAARLECREAR
jgi:hypothetical protein